MRGCRRADPLSEFPHVRGCRVVDLLDAPRSQLPAAQVCRAQSSCGSSRWSSEPWRLGIHGSASPFVLVPPAPA